jgi:hypothetical protein
MALIDIERVVVSPRKLTARVRIADDGPLMTNEDIEGTSRIYYLLPGIVDHVCLGDAGETFRDVMGRTEVAHLLEHMTVELLALSNIAGDVPTGRTFSLEDEPRAFEIELSCADDVLVAGALSSAAWMLDWAYSGGEEPAPDVDGIVAGLVELVNGLPEPLPQQVEEGAVLVDEIVPFEDEAGDVAEVADSFQDEVGTVVEPATDEEPAADASMVVEEEPAEEPVGELEAEDVAPEVEPKPEALPVEPAPEVEEPAAETPEAEEPAFELEDAAGEPVADEAASANAEQTAILKMPHERIPEPHQIR